MVSYTGSTTLGRGMNNAIDTMWFMMEHVSIKFINRKLKSTQLSADPDPGFLLGGGREYREIYASKPKNPIMIRGAHRLSSLYLPMQGDLTIFQVLLILVFGFSCF